MIAGGMADDDEAKVDRWVAHHPPADVSPGEFEQFVAEVLRASEPDLVVLC